MVGLSDVGLARQALRAALETRTMAGVGKRAPICAYDLAEQLGVEVKFVRGSSFDGLYSKTTRTILVPSERPPGRQAFSCAHELGHWRFEHGTTLDGLRQTEHFTATTPDEFLANSFAAHLLMPPWTVKKAFDLRSWATSLASPEQIFVIAGQLGVGYSTLVYHMSRSLQLMSRRTADQLLRRSPKDIRRVLLDGADSDYLLVADDHWDPQVPLDLRVGDYAMVPPVDSIDGSSVKSVASTRRGNVINGVAPGISRLEARSWTAFVRVRRKDFAGRAIYRHLEDPDVDTNA